SENGPPEGMLEGNQAVHGPNRYSIEERLGQGLLAVCLAVGMAVVIAIRIRFSSIAKSICHFGRRSGAAIFSPGRGDFSHAIAIHVSRVLPWLVAEAGISGTITIPPHS